MLDPASDFIFDASASVETKKGWVETFPKTDKDWEKIRIGAVTAGGRRVPAEDSAAVCAARRQQQQQRSRAARGIAGGDKGEAREGSRPVGTRRSRRCATSASRSSRS